ncbi:MAG TPA: iron-containing alcohol dehydrogenase [Bacillota bacterium]|jgi:alcohol dehydrogenase|nr:iron-containing alcohol dehydrogenase [Bacillota bacterium]HOK70421.1 iron-containing alcohol dehydrogenase [Bacillota bacterium]HOL52126.1 iron-containing alcohol dehydrogenase [Bacillota bacterium]HPQ01689.1 iron-containing alcohol dehydrogenase [Bacillota bacterium]HPZ14250.1 iron-containing alcohol dehydrogenase [Bacillota bacterium]
MIPSYYEFINSVKILSGKNALENIPAELRGFEARKPILLTDKMLVKIGLAQQVVDACGGSEIVIGAMYDDIPPDSSVEVVNDIVRVYREKGCDSVIAVGGGSVIDTAKGVCICLTEGTDDLLDHMGVDILRRRKTPFVVVPTTAGTGSEVTGVAVIANPAKNVKMEFVSANILPDVAVLDVRMTKSLPPRLTASTGMDALVHAIEAYTCLQRNPLSDAHAHAAINLIRKYLPRAVRDGKDEEARLAMANASLLAGVAFSNSMVGIVHAVGHACGGVLRAPHGDCMAILLPYGMEYNLSAVSERYAELLLPLAGPEVYARTSASQRAEKSIETVREMSAEYSRICGLPTKLREVGVKKEDFSAIARAAVNDGAMIVNPVEADEDDVLGILEKAY